MTITIIILVFCLEMYRILCFREITVQAICYKIVHKSFDVSLR